MNAIRLPSQVATAMRRHAENCAPAECCGLIATDVFGEIRFIYPLTNADASPGTFTIEPVESFGAFMHADRAGWRIGGVFHSHPTGPEGLSHRDLAEAIDPIWIHFLVTPAGVKCYRIEEGEAVEVGLVEV